VSTNFANIQCTPLRLTTPCDAILNYSPRLLTDCRLSTLSIVDIFNSSYNTVETCLSNPYFLLLALNITSTLPSSITRPYFIHFVHSSIVQNSFTPHPFRSHLIQLVHTSSISSTTRPHLIHFVHNSSIVQTHPSFTIRPFFVCHRPQLFHRSQLVRISSAIVHNSFVASGH
jgi:hypothetical protein